MADWKSVNRIVKQYDRCLYAQQERNGATHIYRRSATNSHLPHFVFALTDTWGATGKPRDWGLEVVVNRLKAIDIWNGRDIAGELIKEHEKIDASSKRQFSNTIESFMLDFRRQFAKATNEINTSTLEKIDTRRKGDLKYGN